MANDSQRHQKIGTLRQQKIAVLHHAAPITINRRLLRDQVEMPGSGMLSAQSDVAAQTDMERPIGAFIFDIAFTGAAALFVQTDAQLAGNIHLLVVVGENIFFQAPAFCIVFDLRDASIFELNVNGHCNFANVAKAAVAHERSAGRIFHNGTTDLKARGRAVVMDPERPVKVRDLAVLGRKEKVGAIGRRNMNSLRVPDHAQRCFGREAGLVDVHCQEIELQHGMPIIGRKRQRQDSFALCNSFFSSLRSQDRIVSSTDDDIIGRENVRVKVKIIADMDPLLRDC